MSYVYFIAAEPYDHVKIGWSLHQPTRRMKELQTGCPHELDLLAWAPASLEDERRLHRVFAPLRLRGEWFRLDEKLGLLVTFLQDHCDEDRFVARDYLHHGLFLAVALPDTLNLPEDEFRRSAKATSWAFPQKYAAELA